jgi:hypothetical protein
LSPALPSFNSSDILFYTELVKLRIDGFSFFVGDVSIFSGKRLII